MWLVFLSHFAYAYFGRTHETTREILNAIGMIASPTFVLVSGLLLGFLYRSSPGNLPRLKRRFVARALFLLTVGHLLMLVAHLPLGLGLRWGFITDAIGVSMIAGVYLIDKLPPHARLLFSLVLYAASWMMALYWHPVDPLLRFIRDSAVGTTADNWYIFNFPVLPWFSLYFAATVLGHRLACTPAGCEPRAAFGFVRQVARVSLAAALLGIALSLTQLPDRAFSGNVLLASKTAAEELAVEHPENPRLDLTSVFHKRPPSPVYLAFFGGLGILLLHCCSRAAGHPVVGRSIVDCFAPLGRTSLFAFIMQYFVYYSGLRLLRPSPSAWWPLYFIGSAIAISGAAAYWDSRGWNRRFGFSLRLPPRVKPTGGGEIGPAA